MVKVQRVSNDDTSLLDPASSAWKTVTSAELQLEPSTLTAQPSQYVQTKWRDSPYGVVTRLNVKAAHNGESIYFHLAWTDDSQDSAIADTDHFADAAAVLFPVNGNASLQSMGSPGLGVNAWYWRADMESPVSVTAEGVGTTSRTEDPELAARGVYAADGWSLVLRRRLLHAADASRSHREGRVNLVAGSSEQVAFAVWQGANKERGGLKAVTLVWQPLEIEA
jgi:DMSO reductase family type II enzyme heme b subunit